MVKPLCPCDRCQDPELVAIEERERRERAGGPALPDTYTADNDVNPICGCHRRSKCVGCGQCTNCDGCYCGEE